MLLQASQSRHRHLHGLMEMAAARNTERLAHDISEKHLDGLEELLQYLSDMRELVTSAPESAPIAAVVERARRDFDAALVAFLFGADQAALDLMRDVMEI